jgi:hypothetical protein
MTFGGQSPKVEIKSEYQKLRAQCKSMVGYSCRYPVKTKVNIIQGEVVILTFENTPKNCRLARMCLGASAPDSISTNFNLLYNEESQTEEESSPVFYLTNRCGEQIS